MRSTLIFMNTDQKQNETWEDTSKILAELLTAEVNLPHTYEELHMQICRARRGTESDVTQTNKRMRGPKPIFVQFVNWRVAEEVRSKVIHLNVRRIVSQMFSKELMERRSSAFKSCREHITKGQNVQRKLEN